MTEPSLLLCDEPTGNLDSATTEDIMALFHELHAEGNTIIIVTHEPEIAARCPRAIRILDGKVHVGCAEGGSCVKKLGRARLRDRARARARARVRNGVPTAGEGAMSSAVAVRVEARDVAGPTSPIASCSRASCAR